MNMVRPYVPARIKYVYNDSISSPKFIVLLCNPSKRAYSDWQHVPFWTDRLLKTHQTFKDFINDSIDKINHLKSKVQYYSTEPVINFKSQTELTTRFTYKKIDNRTSPIHHGMLSLVRYGDVPPASWNFISLKQNYSVDSLESYVNEALDRKWEPYMSFLTSGIYELLLIKWFKYFDAKRDFLFINGDHFIEDPVKEMVKIEQFMKLDAYFKEDQFVQKKNSTFYCFRNKDKKSRMEDDCMAMHNKFRRKGRTRGSEILENDVLDAIKLLDDFYKPFNENLLRLFEKHGIENRQDFKFY